VIDQERDVLAPVAKRRDDQPDGVEPVPEVGAERAAVDLLAQVAVGGGQDADVDRDALGRAPTRLTPRRSMARRSLGWSSSGNSPISSSRRVPPAAASNSPMRRARAPVKAPASCPKSSLSISEAGMEPQSTTTKRPVARGLASWIASAIRPLPVPVSPSMRR
jgi:hypothetical protein